MTAEQLNGMTLSGQHGLSMSVHRNRLNGTFLVNSFYPQFFNIFDGYVSAVFIHFVERWYAKRFLHPDIVAPYDYIFIWDEDLGLENFNAEE